MDRAFFFGYGSLVNRATHAYSDAHRASAKGWRRAWRHSKLRPVSFLTAVPCAQSEIDGLIAHVPGDDWAALDERERAYARVPAEDMVAHPLPEPPGSIAIYAIPDGHHSDPSDENPILLSYLDVVIQGFLREFGEGGAARFFETTSGWDAPVLDDRARPVYPRHQSLTASERDYVNRQLAALGAKIICES